MHATGVLWTAGLALLKGAQCSGASVPPVSTTQRFKTLPGFETRLCKVNILVGEIKQVLVPSRPHETRRIPVLSPQSMHRLRPKHRPLV